MASGSSTTGNILGAIGAVVGGYFGGSGGASMGYAIGSSIGNAFDPPKGPTVSGPRLSDKSVQVSTYGAQLPRFYGTIAGSGNITWLENNQLKETVRKKKQGGKGGGGGTTVKTYTYSATFFLSLGEGPIAGVRRIWCGDKLIYNAGSDDLETIIASNQSAKGFHVYLGTDNQMPDSRYQADVGVANASAFRGEAYIAFYDFQLADYSNTLQAAQFKVEVVQNRTTYAPEVFQSYELTTPVNLRQAVGMYTGIDGDMSVFKSKAVLSGSSVDILVTGANGYHFNKTISIDNNREFMQGWADEPIFAVFKYATSTINVYNNDGALDGEWILSASDWNTSRFYRKSGTDYILRWEYNTIANSTEIYSGTPVVSAIAPELVSATDNSSVNGRIYDIFTADDCIYALTYSRKLVCYDYSWSQQWVVDLSSQTDILLNRNGANGSILRTDAIGIVFIRSAKGFWKISQSGFEYLGNVPSLNINSDGLGGDSVIGDLWITYDSQSNEVQYVKLTPATFPIPTLAEIIETETAMSSLLTQIDIDTSMLTDSVRGYRVSGGSIRSAIEPLQGAFPFDVIQSGYVIKCIPRGQSSSAAISSGDLGAASGGEYSQLLTDSREMDSQLPVKTCVKYLDAEREYAISEQYAERVNTAAVNRVDREFPLVLNANEAAGVAEVLNFLPWLERTEYSFTLPPSFLSAEPGDVVTVTTDAAVYELRITEINYTQDGVLECKGRPNNAAVYNSGASGSEGIPPTGIVTLLGQSLLSIMDIPVVDETLQNDPGYSVAATGFTGGWPGCVMYRSIDNGQSWSDIQAFTGKGTIGYARNSLSANAGGLIQYGGSLTVDLISGEFESVTESQMLNGSNYCAYGIDGRWEIIRFTDASLNVDGSYTLSGFIRGDKGTEFATGIHSDGDFIVMLNDVDNVFVGFPTASIGLPAVYRGVSAGADIGSASDINLTYEGVNLTPLSAVHAKGERDGSSNLAITWTRRTRIGGEWRNSVDASLGESAEAYEIDVMSGATVKRTISSTIQSATYSAADQTTDFGSPQSSVTVRIYQMSATVGRGYPLEVTL